MQKPEQEIIIKKSNELIQARYKLTVEEQRLIVFLASAIHKDDEDFKSYEIRVADFVSLFGLEKRKSIYTELEESSKRLTGRTIELSKDGKKIYASWLSYVEYVEGSGVIRVEFHSSLKPYLLQLKANFTPYNLSCIINFKSSYSIRLYELLKMEVWKAKKSGKKQFEKSFTLEDYRELLGIDKKYYPIFADFRKRVVEPTTIEISEQTDLNIFETKYIKTGRKITGICFVVLIRSEDDKKLKKEKIEKAETEKEETLPEHHPVIDALVNMGFTYENAKSIKAKHGVKRSERNIAYVQGAIKNGKKINSIPGYLNEAIEGDWGKATDDKKALIEAKRQEEALEKARKDKEDEVDRERTKALKKKIIGAFFTLPEGVKNHIKTEYRAVLENKNNKNDLLFWDNTIDSQEQLLTNHIAWGFTNFLIEKNYIN